MKKKNKKRRSKKRKEGRAERIIVSCIRASPLVGRTRRFGDPEFFRRRRSSRGCALSPSLAIQCRVSLSLPESPLFVSLSNVRGFTVVCRPAFLPFRKPLTSCTAIHLPPTLPRRIPRKRFLPSVKLSIHPCYFAARFSLHV